MKLNYLALPGIVAVLTLRCPRDVISAVCGIKEKDYVSIACSQKTRGTQGYAIPQNVKLADFKSVAIWCCAFNATFGYAKLSLS